MTKALADYLRYQGIANEAVLHAMEVVNRELFVPSPLRGYANSDEPLPLNCGQTISQPFLIARMTELLLGDAALTKVLEIGTGSGYQAAILSQIVDQVYSVERIETLHDSAQQLLQQLHYSNIHLKLGDGYQGWQEHAPYDGIIVTAAAETAPEALCQQLANGRRMVIPLGAEGMWQILVVITRNGDQFNSVAYDSVAFVPMLPGIEKAD